MFWADTVLQDFRYAVRTLFKAPAFTLLAIASLALGIGANITVFTVVNGVFINPLPIRTAPELVSVYALDTKTADRGTSLVPLSYPNFRDIQQRSNAFRSMAAFSSPTPLGLLRDGAAAPERVFGELVTAGYFDLLGLQPARGRFFVSEEDRTPGTHALAVLSYGAWQERFGAAPDIVGRTLRLNNVAFTVIGVGPEGFRGLNSVFGPDLWMPSMMAAAITPGQKRDLLDDRTTSAFRVAGRLKSGTTQPAAEANLKAVAASLEREYPDANRGRSLSLRPIVEVAFAPGSRQSGLFGGAVPMGVVGLVLLIACSNVANLLLARAAGRQHEIAVRFALGADRRRIVRQLMTENALLACLGGAASFAVARAGVDFLKSFRPPDVAPNLPDPQLNTTVLLFAIALSVLATVAFGTAPAIFAARVQPADTLKDEARCAGRSLKRRTFTNVLLVGQVAFSVVALCVAALFLRSIQTAYAIDPGFEKRRLALLLLNPGQSGYDRPRAEAFFRDARARASAVPGVLSASLASNLPLFGRSSQRVLREGENPRDASQANMAFVNTVEPAYFETVGIPLLQGRDFSAADREGSEPVAIVNEAMARKQWPGRNPIGQRVRLQNDASFRRIVGIARTANYTSLGESAQPALYVPATQNFSSAMVLYIRTAADPSATLVTVQRQVRLIDPQVSVDDVRTVGTVINQALWGARIGVGLLSTFGFLALILASIGLYGSMAYNVSRRRREIGLRMALGAERGAVLGLVIGQGMRIVGIGLAIGLIATLLVAQGISALLFGVSPVDPIGLGSAVAALVLVALTACYVPARLASRIDPIEALRET